MMQISYKVGPDPKELLADFLIQFSYSQIFVLSDKNSAKYCLPLIRPVLPENTRFLSLPVGESEKNLVSCEKIWRWLTKYNADRKSLLINLGGGVIGDLGGFSASVYKRGIDFLQIPTTLLSMVDSSIGGKTGIDFLTFKNQIGTFKEPVSSLISTVFLKTLSSDELLSGLAEVVKHALISDLNLWEFIRRRELYEQDWDILVKSSLLIKESIVINDPLEAGIRKKLNAGHTIGHAVESLLLNEEKSISHGFCVAAGLIMESLVSYHKGILNETSFIQIEEFVFSNFGFIDLKKNNIKKILSYCMQDKKNSWDKIKLSLIGPIGNCQVDVASSIAEIEEAIRYYIKK